MKLFQFKCESSQPLSTPLTPSTPLSTLIKNIKTSSYPFENKIPRFLWSHLCIDISCLLPSHQQLPIYIQRYQRHILLSFCNQLRMLVCILRRFVQQNLVCIRMFCVLYKRCFLLCRFLSARKTLQVLVSVHIVRWLRCNARNRDIDIVSVVLLDRKQHHMEYIGLAQCSSCWYR